MKSGLLSAEAVAIIEAAFTINFEDWSGVDVDFACPRCKITVNGRGLIRQLDRIVHGKCHGCDLYAGATVTL